MAMMAAGRGVTVDAVRKGAVTMLRTFETVIVQHAAYHKGDRDDLVEHGYFDQWIFDVSCSLQSHMYLKSGSSHLFLVFIQTHLSFQFYIHSFYLISA